MNKYNFVGKSFKENIYLPIQVIFYCNILEISENVESVLDSREI